MSVMCHCIICFNTRFLALVVTDHVIAAPQHDVELSIISQMAFDVVLYVTLTSMFLFFNKVGSMGGFTRSPNHSPWTFTSTLLLLQRLQTFGWFRIGILDTRSDSCLSQR